MKSYELLAAVPIDLALEIIRDTQAVDKAVYKVVLEAVAQARKVRPVFLERQPRVQRHNTMLDVLTRPALDSAADNLIRTWLLKKQTGLLTDFLDALQIKHEKGVVEDLPKTVSDEALRAAVDQLLTKHRPQVVSLYLSAFNDMNESSWTNLVELLKTDPRLQL